MTDELSEDDVLALLEGKSTSERTQKKKSKIAEETEKGLRPWQHKEATIRKGPVRRTEKENRCAKKYTLHARECGSPTNFKYNEIPYCMVHLIYELNDRLIELGD